MHIAARLALRVVVLVPVFLVTTPPGRAHAHGDPGHEHESPAAVVAPAGRTQGLGPKRLYIANDDHTDYYWSGDAAAYRDAFVNMLEYYMDQAEATATNPPDSRGRFNTDGSLWVREYEQARPPAAFRRLIGHLHAGDITMPLNTVVSLYGAMPAEAVLRDMYWAGRLERRENLRFPLVVPNEDQTLPGGVASLWAGAGARYSWKGICDCNTQIDARDRPREAYRFVGPDGQSVLMKWNSAPFGNESIGGYAEARDPYAAVELLDAKAEFTSRWPWEMAGAFGHGWDDFQTTTDAFVRASRELSTADRRVIVSNEVDFFKDFENNARAVPSFSGSFGNEWDLLTASLGAVTSAFKRDVERLRTAEALATVVSVHDSTFMRGRESSRDSAFMACGLYYEHNWSSTGDVGAAAREAWVRGLERTLGEYVGTLEADGLVRLGALVRDTAGAERHVVFNPLSWPRTDAADLDASTPAPRHVIDVSSGREVPSQEIDLEGGHRLRILAADVPAVGYRVYEVRSGAGAAFPASAVVALPAVTHDSYRVTLGPRGEIAGLLDRKTGGRELVAPGGALHDLGSGSGTVTVESQGPVSTTLRVDAGGSPAHETRLTLIRGVDRVDVEGVVTENFSDDVAWKSTFALPGAVMRHEEVGMIARVGRVSEGGDYADANARTDWLTFNHFVDLSQDGYGVTLSNRDSPFFQPGRSTITTLDATTPSIRAVVGMQAQGTHRGIADQGGDRRFVQRYALRTHGSWDAGQAMRFALEHQNPLVTTRAAGDAGAPLPAASWSLISLGPDDVVLWALKPAEEGIGKGVIARVWNVADGPRTMSLALPGLGLTDARRTTHIETDLERVDVAGGLLVESLARQQMATYRLFPGGSLGVGQPLSVGVGLAVYPNPGAGAAPRRVDFTLPVAARVKVTIHDLRGAVIATPLDAPFAPGRHSAQWDGRDARGGRPPAGVYFVRFEAGGRSESRRVVVLE